MAASSSFSCEVCSSQCGAATDGRSSRRGAPTDGAATGTAAACTAATIGAAAAGALAAPTEHCAAGGAARGTVAQAPPASERVMPGGELGSAAASGTVMEWRCRFIGGGGGDRSAASCAMPPPALTGVMTRLLPPISAASSSSSAAMMWKGDLERRGSPAAALTPKGRVHAGEGERLGRARIGKPPEIPGEAPRAPDDDDEEEDEGEQLADDGSSRTRANVTGEHGPRARVLRTARGCAHACVFELDVGLPSPSFRCGVQSSGAGGGAAAAEEAVALMVEAKGAGAAEDDALCISLGRSRPGSSVHTEQGLSQINCAIRGF